MKRNVVSLVGAVSVLLLAGNPSALSAEIDAQDFLMLKQTVESQLETIDGLKRRLAGIESQLAEARRDLDSVKRSNSSSAKDYATQEQLRALAGKLEQIDTNRANDSKRIFEALRKFADTPPAPIPTPLAGNAGNGPSVSPSERRNSKTPSEFTDPGSKPEKPEKPDIKIPKPTIELPAESYQHIVKPNETLSEILIAYRKEYGLKTTMAHVEAANPGLNPKKLKVDQKINIPAVK